VGQAKLKAAQQRDGHYLLRSNLTGEDPTVLWARYVQLTQIERVFLLVEERTRHPAELSSTGASRGCTRADRFRTCQVFCVNAVSKRG